MKKIIITLLVLFLSACNVESEEVVLPPVIEEIPEVVEQPTEIEVIVEDVVEEEPEEIIDEVVTLPISQTINPAQFGRVGVLTDTMVADGGSYLLRLRHEIFNDPDEFFNANLNTLVFIYRHDNVDFYPPEQLGQTIEPGELLGYVDDQGRVIIMIRYKSFARSEISVFDTRILSLRGRITSEELVEIYDQLLLNEPTAPWQTETFELSSIDRLSPPDVCRLRTTLRHQDGSRRGFPYAPAGTKDKGNVRVAVIPLDFPNFAGDPSALGAIKEDVLQAEAWSEFMTAGAMNYEIVFVEEWVRLPRPNTHYPVYTEPFSNEFQSWQTIMDQVFRAIDPYVDLREIDFIYFVFPYEALLDRPSLLYGRVRTTTPRAGLVEMAVYGNEQSISYTIFNFWTHLVHEVLHFQGFAGHGPCLSCPLSIMINDNGFSKAILSWEGFLADWYQDDHVQCIEKSELSEPFVVELDSLDQLGGAPGAKNIMVRLSNTKLLIVEYRTDGPFSNLPRYMHGIFPYVIDISKGSTYPQRSWDQGVIDLDNYWYAIYPSNPNDQTSMIYQPGSSFAYDNVVVKVLAPNVIELQNRN